MHFLSKKKNKNSSSENKKVNNKDTISIAVLASVEESAARSSAEAAMKFAKSPMYNRKLIDDSAAKINIKKNVFANDKKVMDPYTKQNLVLSKSEAKLQYGDDSANHLAEADHIISLQNRHKQTKDNPWLTNENIKKSSNSSDNLEVVSRKFNNAKRGRSNEEFISDEKYLEKTGVRLSEEGKQKAINSQKLAEKSLKYRDIKDSFNNIIDTGHRAGKNAALSSLKMGFTMSSILNLREVIEGRKSVEDALKDTIIDTGKAAATGYTIGGGLTILSHTLSNSSSKFLRALSKSNVPAKLISTIIITGDTLKKYGNGEISTQECLIELGEKGLNVVTAGYSMAVGQALIPIPVVGAAVGAIVGSVMTSNYYNYLVKTLKQKELEHEERLRIIKECEIASSQLIKFRKELESYLQIYFKDYKDCFDDALNTIYTAFKVGNANGIISGPNKITKKLGGKVQYEDMEEFEDFLFSEEVFIL